MKSTAKREMPMALLMIVEIVVGIMLLVNPHSFIRAVIVIFGIVLLAIGAFSLINYFRTRSTEGAGNAPLIGGLVALAFGIAAIVIGSTGLFEALMAVVIILVAIIVIVAGVVKLANFFNMKKEGFPVSWLRIIGAIVAVVAGLVVLFNPFGSEDFLWRFLGIMMIVMAVVDLMSFFLRGPGNGQIVEEGTNHYQNNNSNDNSNKNG